MKGYRFDAPTLAMKLYNVHRNTVSNNSAKPRVLLATPPKPSFALNPAGDLDLDSSSGLEGTATSFSSCTCCRSRESDPSSDKVDIAGAISYLRCESSFPGCAQLCASRPESR